MCAVGARVEVTGQFVGVSQFFPSTTWVMGIELRSSGLVVSTFTWAEYMNHRADVRTDQFGRPQGFISRAQKSMEQGK